MFMLLTALPAALTIWALGGRLTSLIGHRWRGLWLIWLSLAIQIVLFTPIGNGLDGGVIRAAHVATYLPLVAFLLVNRGAGLGVTAAGVALNVIAIAANRGLMPADATAQQVVASLQGTLHHPINTDSVHPHLLFLGDVMALPAWFPFANAFSIGDVLIALGLVWAVACLSRGRGPAGEPDTGPALPLPALAGAAAPWAVLAVAGGALPSGDGWLAAAALAIFATLALAARHVRLPATAPAGIGLVAVAAACAGWNATAAALVAAAGAGLLARSFGAGAPRGAPPLMTAMLPPLAAGAGLAAGLAAVRLLGTAPGLAAAALLAIVTTLLRPPATRRAPRGRTAPPARRIAVAAACACAGALAVSGTVHAAGAVGLGRTALAVLACASAMGACIGIRMGRRLALELTPGVLGLASVFAAASAVLLQTATLAMTAVAAAVVLGISAGAAAWAARGHAAADDLHRVAPAFLAGLGLAAAAGPDAATACVVAVLGLAALPLLAWRLRTPAVTVADAR